MTDIIISNYNYAHFIEECIESCLKQKDVNIIVVDDCSTDKSVEILTGYGDKITFLGMIKNSGVSAARNVGLIASESEYIQILDADDMLTDKSIERRVDVLESRPNLDAIYGTTLELKNGKITPHKSELATHYILFRRRVFEKYGLFYEGLRTKEDKEFKYRIGLHKQSYQKDKIKVKKIDFPVAIYRRHENAKRKLRSKDIYAEVDTIMKFDSRVKDIEINGITSENTVML